MRLIGLCVIALVSSAAAQPAAPEGGAVVEGGDSAEGCQFQYVTTAPLDGRAAPTSSGRVIRTVLTQRRIEVNDRSEAWTVVHRPGRLRAERPLVLEDIERLGARSTIRFNGAESRVATLQLVPGDEVDLLMHSDEGFSYIRHRGVVYYGGGIHVGPYLYDDGRRARRVVDFTALSEPETSLWLRLTPRGGKPAAWVNVTGRVEVIGCSGELE